MKTRQCLAIAFIAAASMFAVEANAAETSGTISAGGYIGLGGVNAFSDNFDAAVSMSVHPEVNYFIMDNLSLNFRFLWERYFYGDADLDVIPFLLGVSYYVPITKKLTAPIGAAFGMTVVKASAGDKDSKARLALDAHAGLSYMMTKEVAVIAMLDLLMPNVLIRGDHERYLARTAVLVGFAYYF